MYSKSSYGHVNLGFGIGESAEEGKVQSHWVKDW